ncbi:hypothetical protein [Candidatus Thiodictyon syntrophicum]|uniref:Uncharacterized protein n=1 Tax=Candidatus Thiodictyon syntrophicum TaxID=1166950 RepID=A0A2K8UCN7_9GAMM|nr:hypothetical protein [Candidatus Thiodictyon syntrophicum]AUB83354.1 hypothetical protein THSYN_22030 [Candidatus Thiodictyon syntrophicum]
MSRTGPVGCAARTAALTKTHAISFIRGLGRCARRTLRQGSEQLRLVADLAGALRRRDLDCAALHPGDDLRAIQATTARDARHRTELGRVFP